MKKIKQSIDPRVCLYLILLAVTLIMMRVTIWMEIIVVIFFSSLFFYQKDYRTGFYFLVIYFLQLLFAVFLLPHIKFTFFIYIFSFLTVGIRHLMPGIIAGTYALKHTSIEEWIALCKKWQVPRFITIPIAVMGRFFPTIAVDYQKIRQAMAFRGIGNNFWDALRHPVQTFEYILIPLLMNASQVGEDLTISALTKGLGMPVRQTSLVQLKMQPEDWFFSLAGTFLLLLYLGVNI